MSIEKPHPHRQQIIDELKKIEWDTLLEPGCGEGENLYWIQKEFPDKKLTGLDINEERVRDTVKRLPEAAIHIGDIRNLPWDKDSFDVVLVDATLIYIEQHDMEVVVGHLKRIAKKMIILSEWHDEGDEKMQFGHWVRDYIKFFQGAKLKKITGWDNSNGWSKYGHLIIYGKDFRRTS